MMTAVEPDGRVTRSVDSLLDEIFHLFLNRDEAIRICRKSSIEHPEMNAVLSSIIARLTCEHPEPEPIEWDSFGAPIYAHAKE